MDRYIYVCENDDERIDAWLATKKEHGLSRSYIAKLIKQECITLDGETVKPSTRTRAGGEVEMIVIEPAPDVAMPQNIDLDVIYEDEWMLVVNKARGMVTHPGAGNPDGTLSNALLYYCRGHLSDIGGIARPGIVHRLDKDTSGVIIAAKTNEAHVKLSEMFAKREVHKKYLAIVQGTFENNTGTIDAPIGRAMNDRVKMCVDVEHGKPALTKFSVRERFNKYTFLDVEIFTGRTHQIRVHMNFIGRPVAGDPLYGHGDPVFDKIGGGQLLHAREISFIHPMTGEKMIFDTGIPDYMQKAVDMIKLRGL